MFLALKLPVDAGIELHRGGELVIAEHVAERERDAAADGGAEPTGADADVGCPIAFERQLGL